MTLALNSLPPDIPPHAQLDGVDVVSGRGDCYSMIDGERKDWQQHAVM